MFNSKMIGTNSAGGNQPEGTGAMVVTCSSSVVGEGGLWISVDDGVTWSQDAFTGIDDPTDNAAWGNWVKWMGSYFALRNNTTKAIYISPDGYNWTESFTPAGDSINSMALDQVTGDAFISSYIWRGNNYLYRSTDGGATWSGWDVTDVSLYNNFDDMKVYNGKWMASQRFGHAWSNDNGQSWTFRNSMGYNQKFIAQNGRWNIFGFDDNTSNARAATTNVTSSVDRLENWTITDLTTVGFSSNIWGPYVARPTGDGQNKILQYARTRFLSPVDVCYVAYSIDNGVNWVKWKTEDVSYNQNTLFHNGYFFYREGYDLIKTNDFSTEIAVSTTPFPFNNVMASMSITW